MRDSGGVGQGRPYDPSPLVPTSLNPESASMSAQGLPATPGVPVQSLTDRLRRSLPALRETFGRAGGPGTNNSLAITPTTDLGNDDRAKVDPEDVFRANCIRELNDGRPIHDRIKAAKAASTGIKHYSVETLMVIWVEAEDLTTADAPLEARRAGFKLLIESVSHSGLKDSERLKLFRMVIVPVQASDSGLQILALQQLTQSGRNLNPSELESTLVPFLITLVKQLFEATKFARSEVKKSRLRRTNNSIGEEVGFEALLALIADIVTSDPTAFQGEHLTSLVDQVIWVSRNATIPADLHGTFKIMKAVIESSRLPQPCLEPFIEVLCGIYSQEESGDPWSCYCILLKSQDKAEVLQILLSMLTETPGKLLLHTARGALLTIKDIVANNGRNGIPTIPVQALVNAFRATFIAVPKLQLVCLQTIRSFLIDRDIADRLLNENWMTVLRPIAAEFLGASIEQRLPTNRPGEISTDSAFSSIRTTDRTMSVEIVQELQHIASSLEPYWSDFTTRQKEPIVGIFLGIGVYVDFPQLQLVIDQIMVDCKNIPHHLSWAWSLKLLVIVVLLDPTKTESKRCQVLQIVQTVSMATHEDEGSTLACRGIVLFILRNMLAEEYLSVVNNFAEFVTDYSRNADTEIFDNVLRTLGRLAASEDRSPKPQINRTVSFLVRLFLQCLLSSTFKANLVYRVLVFIACHTTNCSTGTRLTALKLLMRLRCDSNRTISVVPFPDSQGLAAMLSRTETLASQNIDSRVASSEDSQTARVGRTSAIDHSRPGRSRSTTRSANANDGSAKPTAPLWMYLDLFDMPRDALTELSQTINARRTGLEDRGIIETSYWLQSMMETLKSDVDWEIHSYILVHLPSQLSNLSFFIDDISVVRQIYEYIMSELKNRKFGDPHPSTGVKKGDVALCLFQTLTVLLGYHEHFRREELDTIVKAFLAGISMWDRAAKCCIHALAQCCYEIPVCVSRNIQKIIDKFSQIITQSHLAIDVLEFLGGLARLPDGCRGIDRDYYRTIFGICIRHIHNSQEQRRKAISASGSRPSATGARYSGTSGEYGMTSETSNAIEEQRDLPEYVFALAYHVLTVWFLRLDIWERKFHVGWITKSMLLKDDEGKEIMEEQSNVTRDMMHRTAYSDLGETMSTPSSLTFKDEDGPVLNKTWLVGMSIVTVETATVSGLSKITKRQASGTTHSVYQPCTALLPPHHVATQGLIQGTERLLVYPDHIFLQLLSTISPVPVPEQPIPLPDDDSIRRAISTFDRNDTVDGYKVGVIYVGENQSAESEILANTTGTEAYDTLLSGLGTEVCLRNASFNTQGLDHKSDLDGKHTYAWRDRVTEIVFHVTTMMPTDLKNDPQCVNKKRHIGNDFVNIIYNDSGLPFRFDTIPSQFNYVNIVITPEAPTLSRYTTLNADERQPDDVSPGRPDDQRRYHGERQFFKVQTLCSPSFPQVSPAATPKIISAFALAAFVRQLALNACVFSLVWSNRQGGEHVSSWRNRLKEIRRLRERHANTAMSKNISYPGMGNAQDRGGAKAYVDGDTWHGSVALGGMAEEDQALQGLDFTRWTG